MVYNPVHGDSFRTLNGFLCRNSSTLNRCGNVGASCTHAGYHAVFIHLQDILVRAFKNDGFVICGICRVKADTQRSGISLRYPGFSAQGNGLQGYFGSCSVLSIHSIGFNT